MEKGVICPFAKASIEKENAWVSPYGSEGLRHPDPNKDAHAQA